MSIETALTSATGAATSAGLAGDIDIRRDSDTPELMYRADFIAWPDLRVRATARGADRAAAIANLALVIAGNEAEVAQATRLAISQRQEAETQTAYDAAVAEREAIEAEPR